MRNCVKTFLKIWEFFSEAMASPVRPDKTEETMLLPSFPEAADGAAEEGECFNHRVLPGANERFAAGRVDCHK
jgi:hypothetical protein